MINYDTNSELIVQPYLNGVKLAERTDKSTIFPSIESLFAMPFMVYFVRFDAHYVNANHFTRLTNIPDDQGYYSENDLKDTPFSTIFKNESVRSLNHQNRNVLHTKRLNIYESQTFRLDELSFSCLSFKLPLYETQDKIMGVFGMSLLMDNSVFEVAEPLSTSMERIIQTGLISHAKNILPGTHLDGVYFSTQEIKCLRLLLSGKTIKLIGAHMGLSPRTVEYYLNNIKRKLQVKTKSELIEKVVQHIWPEMLL